MTAPWCVSEECIYQNPGQSCYVRCATAFGWFGEPALYVCLQNENYEGTPPICVTTTSTTTTSITRTTTTKTDLIVCGGGLPLGVGIDASDCSGQVTSGDICTDFGCPFPDTHRQECLVPSTWAQDPTFNTTCAGTTHGETCVAQCSQGYTGPSTQFLCDNGNLAGTPPTCTGIVCAFQGFEQLVCPQFC
eukprot:g10876.t1